MERLSAIKKEINEKKGKEWVGLQPKTEKQIEQLKWYLDHPKVQENLKIAEELIGLYYIAKASNFIKMEDIIRKLDQLSVTLGKAEFVEKEGVTGPIDVAIEELIKKIENLMENPSGMSLPEGTQKSIATFLNYLNHPKLQNKTKLFEEMVEKYAIAEASDFRKMQALNDMLNMLEIKLGALTGKVKKWKSLEDIREELLEEKKKLAEGWENLETEKKEIELAREKLEAEREKLDMEKRGVEAAKESLTVERKKLEVEKRGVEAAKESLTVQREKLEAKKKEMEEERKKLEVLTEKLNRDEKMENQSI
ncbi:MAG: hypothetical protein ACFFAN_00240 [Promethearchaeota archaeon]